MKSLLEFFSFKEITGFYFSFIILALLVIYAALILYFFIKKNKSDSDTLSDCDNPELDDYFWPNNFTGEENGLV